MLSDVKKFKFPPGFSSKHEEKGLLSKMLHKRPDLRPEAKEILSHTWLRETADAAGAGWRRLDTLFSDDGTMGVDILNEEILDN